MSPRPRSLTDEQAQEIRERAVNGDSIRLLADDYSVSHTTIRRVVQGVSYKDAAGPKRRRKRSSVAAQLKRARKRHDPGPLYDEEDL